MKWINATDKPPGDGDVLLICDHHGCYFLATYFDGNWDTVDMKPVNAAYWMELPPCPAAVLDADADLFEEPFVADPPVSVNSDMRVWAEALHDKER